MILLFYGRSKTGKTTLIVKLIKELKEKGYRVGSVKNIHSPDFTIDTEGKDTWEHAHAGSEIVVANSGSETAFMVNREIEPSGILNYVNSFADLDIIIVEGDWDHDGPKVALGDIEDKDHTVIRYSDNYDEVLSYAIDGIELDRVEKKLPGLDCGKCGLDTCHELAGSIYKGKNSIEDCYYFSDMNVSLKVDGEEIPLGKFAKEFVAGTVWGMVSSLKGVEDGDKIVLKLEK
jgi:molybdopterin-guanine dinucleotide biosynthesis protein B